MELSYLQRSELEIILKGPLTKCYYLFPVHPLICCCGQETGNKDSNGCNRAHTTMLLWSRQYADSSLLLIAGFDRQLPFVYNTRAIELVQEGFYTYSYLLCIHTYVTGPFD